MENSEFYKSSSMNADNLLKVVLLLAGLSSLYQEQK